MNKLLFFIVISFLVHVSYAQTDSIDYFGQIAPGDSAVILPKISFLSQIAWKAV